MGKRSMAPMMESGRLAALSLLAACALAGAAAAQPFARFGTPPAPIDVPEAPLAPDAEYKSTSRPYRLRVDRCRYDPDSLDDRVCTMFFPQLGRE